MTEIAIDLLKRVRNVLSDAGEVSGDSSTITYHPKSNDPLSYYRTGSIKRKSWSRPIQKQPNEGLKLFINMVLKQCMQEGLPYELQTNIRQRLPHIEVEQSQEILDYLKRNPRPFQVRYKRE